MLMSDGSIEVDRTGFPMVRVDELGIYVHWLPVTKVQFEYFLCEVGDSYFDTNWYETVLDLNSRVSPAAVERNNYWQALITGLLPSEAQRYARWCGSQYELPTAEQWLAVFRALANQSPLELSTVLSFPGLNERARVLLERLDEAPRTMLDRLGYERTRADQLLLRLGVLEWVKRPHEANQWGLFGELNPSFHSLIFSPDDGAPRIPRAPETQRVGHYGFRLFRRIS